MKKIISAALLAAALAACDNGGEYKGPDTKKFVLKCGSYDVAVEVGAGDVLNTTVNGEKITMKPVVSASGSKYEGKGAATSAYLWNKGLDWALGIGKDHIDCK